MKFLHLSYVMLKIKKDRSEVEAVDGGETDSNDEKTDEEKNDDGLALSC